MRRRGLPARAVRGARLQRRRPRPEGLQRRRAAVETAVRRGEPRPARRRRRRPGALHRGGGLDRQRARCASPRIYLPNGNPPDTDKFAYKLAWMERLSAYARERLPLEEPLVLAGDYNVIPSRRRCAQSASLGRATRCSSRDTRGAFRALINLGLTDAVRAATDEPGIYTFWDYQAGAWQKNNGIRIDHLLLSPQAADRLTASASTGTCAPGTSRPTTCRCGSIWPSTRRRSVSREALRS